MPQLVILSQFSNNITTRAISEQIYRTIATALQNSDVTVDFANISTITTFCAKSIFGRLYVELGEQQFFTQMHIINTNDDQKIIIQEGISDFLDEHISGNRVE